MAKAPVLPVILRYPYQRFSPAWDSISGVSSLISQILGLLVLEKMLNVSHNIVQPLSCPVNLEGSCSIFICYLSGLINQCLKRNWHSVLLLKKSVGLYSYSYVLGLAYILFKGAVKNQSNARAHTHGYNI